MRKVQILCKYLDDNYRHPICRRGTDEYGVPDRTYDPNYQDNR